MGIGRSLGYELRKVVFAILLNLAYGFEKQLKPDVLHPRLYSENSSFSYELPFTAYHVELR